jgi:hypothetical protein
MSEPKCNAKNKPKQQIIHDFESNNVFDPEATSTPKEAQLKSSGSNWSNIVSELKSKRQNLKPTDSYRNGFKPQAFNTSSALEVEAQPKPEKQSEAAKTSQKTPAPSRDSGSHFTFSSEHQTLAKEYENPSTSEDEQRRILMKLAPSTSGSQSKSNQQPQHSNRPDSDKAANANKKSPPLHDQKSFLFDTSHQQQEVQIDSNKASQPEKSKPSHSTQRTEREIPKNAVVNKLLEVKNILRAF